MKKLCAIFSVFALCFSTHAADTCYVKVNGNNFAWGYNSNPDGTYVSSTIIQPGTDYGFTFDIYGLDNSFNMEINGVEIATNEIQFYGTQGINIEFADGAQYENNTPNIWLIVGNANSPMIRVTISPTGQVALFGSKNSYGPLFPLQPKTAVGNAFTYNTIPWNISSDNIVKVRQLVYASTSMYGYGYGRTIVSKPQVNAGPDVDICIGETVTLTANNPNNVTISWDNGVQDGIAFSPSTLGTTNYTITATDESNSIYTENGVNTCFSTDELMVMVHNLPVVNAGNNINKCYGESVVLNGSGAGTGGIYNWDNGATNGVAFTPPSGTTTYTVTGTDAIGCKNTDQMDVVMDPLPIISAGTDQTVCDDGSQVTLTGSGAGSGGTYSWDNGVSDGVAFTPNSGTIPYTVTGTGANGCENTDQVNVIVDPLPTIDAGTDQSVCLGGSVTLTAINPDGATISWDHSITDGQSFTVITTETYTVTADLNGCISTDEVTITVNPLPTFTTTITDPTCGDNNGEIQIIPSSGGSITDFSIDNGATTQNGGTFPSLDPGTYPILITDANGCEATGSESLSNISGSTIDNISSTDVSCSSDDGTITVTASGGIAPLSFSLDNGQTSNNGTFTGLAVGSYVVTVTDTNGCETDQSVTVVKVSDPTITIVNSVDVSCFGETDGTAEVSATGGTAPYTYNWTPAGGNAASASGLTPGTYTVTVEDNAGCTDDLQITISEPHIISIQETITPSDCGKDNGEIVINGSGGTGNYTYVWNPNVSTSNLATDLAVGTYKVTLTDANGCIKAASYDVPLADPFYTEANPDNTTILQGESADLNLFVDPNTTIDNISWMPSEGLSCSDCKNPIATPDNSTTYIATVTDEYGCTSSDTVRINVIPPCADLFVPNTFSPNGDGLNDLQCVLGECVVSLEFTIFNRWGEAIFYTLDQKECWDGTFRGKRVQSGVYVYILKVTLENGMKKEETGSINLVR